MASALSKAQAYYDPRGDYDFERKLGLYQKEWEHAMDRARHSHDPYERQQMLTAAQRLEEMARAEQAVRMHGAARSMLNPATQRYPDGKGLDDLANEVSRKPQPITKRKVLLLCSL